MEKYYVSTPSPLLASQVTTDNGWMDGWLERWMCVYVNCMHASMWLGMVRPMYICWSLFLMSFCMELYLWSMFLYLVVCHYQSTYVLMLVFTHYPRSTRTTAGRRGLHLPRPQSRRFVLFKLIFICCNVDI